jgi:hypothetical protein
MWICRIEHVSIIRLFWPRFCPHHPPSLYLHKRECKENSKSTTVILVYINKIKWHIGHSDYLEFRSIVPSEYWADTINKYCYHSFLSYFPYDTKAVEQNIWVIFQMHTNHYFPFPQQRGLFTYFFNSYRLVVIRFNI